MLKHLSLPLGPEHARRPSGPGHVPLESEERKPPELQQRGRDQCERAAGYVVVRGVPREGESQFLT